VTIDRRALTTTSVCCHPVVTDTIHATLLVAVLGCGAPSAPEVKAPAKEPPSPTPVQLEETVVAVELALQGSNLHISVRDGTAPIRTDVWLYTLEDGQLAAFTAFEDPDSRRKSRRLMMPATIAGRPSGLVPASSDENGFMTDGVRESRTNGTVAPAIDGDVVVVLEAIPASPLVVVVALEDQRYAGAAAIDASGAPVTLPPSVGAPLKHVARTFEADIKPLMKLCTDCHAPDEEAASIPLVGYDDLVNFDLAFAEGKEKCAKQHADAGARMACVNAISEVEYLVEPGAPALSPLARRTRPDEERDASVEGLRWFGKSGKRFGGHGDRRMPPQNTTETTSDDRNEPTHFDEHPQDFQMLFDWIAQGATR
jgi:hypothetical protein